MRTEAKKKNSMILSIDQVKALLYHLSHSPTLFAFTAFQVVSHTSFLGQVL
jgi:hypothetical protein